MAPRDFLVKLTPQSAAAWHALVTDLFPGEACLRTANSTYRLVEGVLQSHAKRAAGAQAGASPLLGLHLLGFLVDEGGFCSLSPRWRPGAHAVLWNPDGEGERAFILTSLVVAFALEPAVPAAPPRSGVASKVSRPSSIALRTLPASTTRLHAAEAASAR